MQNGSNRWENDREGCGHFDRGLVGLGPEVVHCEGCDTACLATQDVSSSIRRPGFMLWPDFNERKNWSRSSRWWCCLHRSRRLFAEGKQRGGVEASVGAGQAKHGQHGRHLESAANHNSGPVLVSDRGKCTQSTLERCWRGLIWSLQTFYVSSHRASLDGQFPEKASAGSACTCIDEPEESRKLYVFGPNGWLVGSEKYAQGCATPGSRPITASGGAGDFSAAV